MIQTQAAYEAIARTMVNRIIEQFHPEKIIVFGSGSETGTELFYSFLASLLGLSCSAFEASCKFQI